jgi:hypothetical protein
MTVRFHTTINNGTIRIPVEIADQLPDKGEIEVELTPKAEKKGSEPVDIIRELMVNPLKIIDRTPITRDELYDRKL